jgi:hypothetical protein
MWEPTLPGQANDLEDPAVYSDHPVTRRRTSTRDDPSGQSVLHRVGDLPSTFAQKASVDSLPVRRIGGHFVLLQPSRDTVACAKNRNSRGDSTLILLCGPRRTNILLPFSEHHDFVPSSRLDEEGRIAIVTTGEAGTRWTRRAVRRVGEGAHAPCPPSILRTALLGWWLASPTL